MKHAFRFLILALAVLGTSQLYAQSDKPEMVKYTLKTVYLPLGFDSNDRVQIAAEGKLPDTCYKAGPITAKVNKETKKIELRSRVYKYDTVCLRMRTTFHQIAEVGILPEGNYKVVNEVGDELGVLPVRKATTSAPDDHLYAPVGDSRVMTDENDSQLINIEGVFPDACLKMKEVRVFVDGRNVVTVLPIAEKTGSNCMIASFPYKTTASLPASLAKGSYLLNTRSLNGEGVFRFFEVVAP